MFRTSEAVFVNHKYLTNPPVTDAYQVVDAARALCEALSKMKQQMHNNTMENLKKLSDIFLTITKSNKDSSWEDPAKNTPKKPVTTK